MKLLITSDFNSENTYVSSIVKALPKTCQVVCDVLSFWNSEENFDIVHIQWPEELFDWKIVKKTDVQRLNERLRWWKSRSAKIILTRHNEYPHIANAFSKQLYHTVFKYCDGIVHLGNYSLKKLSSPNVLNVVIPHVNYDSLVRETIKTDARKKMGLPKKGFFYMTFGAIRTYEEELQIINGFKKIKDKNDFLIIANTLLMKKKSSYKKHPWLYLKHLIKTFFYKFKHITFIQGRISNTNLSLYFNAADVIVSPRLNTLNSGVVFMGFSFSKVVVGPNSGNIGEVLKSLNNPVFQPLDTLSVSNALKTAKELSENGHGILNNKYSKKHLSTKNIGGQHHELYRKLLDRIK